MKIYLMTNDKYMKLLRYYPYFFKKNIGDYKVDVLGYKRPGFKLDSNFNYISLGDCCEGIEERKWKWSNGLIPFFNGIDEDYFLLLWDEHIPIFPINKEDLDKMECLIRSDKAAKAILDLQDIWKHPKERIYDNIGKLHQKERYKTTLYASIWKRDYFLSMLYPDMDAWNFETKNMKVSWEDPRAVLAPMKRDILTVFDFYRKGKFNDKQYKEFYERLSCDDIEMIKEMRKL